MRIISGLINFVRSCLSTEDGDKVDQHQAFSNDMVINRLDALSRAERDWVSSKLPRPWGIETVAMVEELSTRYRRGER